MTRFKFRLRALLKLRMHREDAARQELARAQRELMTAEQGLAAVISERSAVAEETARGGEAADLSALAAGYARTQLLRKAELESREQVAALGSVHDERLEEALKAQMDRKALERLRDRQKERHRRELRREDERQTDETGTQAAARRIIEDRRAAGER